MVDKSRIIPKVKREILLCLGMFGGELCVSEVAKKVGRTYGATCFSIKSMVKDGFVIYERKEKNRLKLIPLLTPLGNDVVQAIYKLDRAMVGSK